jgi:UDP-galactopyranose mutase
MDEFSIETRSQNIFHSKTKEYFEEVVSSYQAGNYRSAVVMLWSVVVCDLLFKLQYLVDMYGDETARAILKEVSDLQEKDKKLSTWEHKLIELVRQRQISRSI